MKPTKRPTMLSATFVRTVNVPGRYGDGRGGLGLSLLVRPGSRSRLAEGRDPRRRSARGAPTFAEACEKVMAIHAGNWKPGGRTEDSWRSTPRDYMLPKLGDMPVDAITGAEVMTVLQPIWTEKRETARRVRSRIGAVMKWAVAQGHRADNPAGDALAAALRLVRASDAYRRSDLLERRRTLMQQWAEYLSAPA